MKEESKKQNKTEQNWEPKITKIVVQSHTTEKYMKLWHLLLLFDFLCSVLP